MVVDFGFVWFCILMLPVVILLIWLMILLYCEFKKEILNLKEYTIKTTNKGKLKKIQDIIESYEEGEPSEYTVLRINNIKDILNK